MMRSLKHDLIRLCLLDGTDLRGADLEAAADKIMADTSPSAPRVERCINPFPWRGGKAFRLAMSRESRAAMLREAVASCAIG